MINLDKFIKTYRLLAMTIVLIILGIGIAVYGRAGIVQYIFSTFAILVALKLGVSMIRTLRDGKYGVDVLAITAIVSTVAVGEYWASIVIVMMLVGGEALEDYAARRARQELTALLDRAPQTAKIVGKDGEVREVALAVVKPGDVLLVEPGGVVPVDAILLDTVAELDESLLTGESLPVEHKKGAELLSGSINGGKAIKIRSLKLASDSQYQQILELVKAAAGDDAPFVRLADRYAVPFTLIAFIIAGVAWAIAGDPLRFAQVMVVATPCPLLLGAPIAMISGMSRAARNGIIIKSGGVLERLATIKAVAFDKTGTLTRGEPKVVDIISSEGFEAEDVIRYAASAEQDSTHILAEALASECNRRGIKLVRPQDVEEVTAQGLRARVDSRRLLVGKREFLVKNHIAVAVHENDVTETAVYVAVDGDFAGIITFRDEARMESKSVIKQLKLLGIRRSLMVTGDRQATADRIALQVGISDIYAECLPADKVKAIEGLKIRPVMSVGDGVNDAPLLAVADVGMAMGARGSSAASETADVVVLVDDLMKVPQAIYIAKRTVYIATQSVWIGIIISVILMLAAALGFIPVLVGAGLQELVDVAVIFNALRAHGQGGSGDYVK